MNIDSHPNSDSDSESVADLDLSWIDDFLATDKDYKDFYAEDIMFVKLHIVYLDKLSNITNLKEETAFMNTPNLLTREHILRIIKTHCIYDDIKYSVLSILKYNFTLSPNDLKAFLKSNNPSIGSTYLTPIRNIDSILFEQTITLFHDINDLFIIFFDNNASNTLVPVTSIGGAKHIVNNHNLTKKIVFTPSLGNNAITYSNAYPTNPYAKAIANKKHKNTLRKQYKDNTLI
jgi:hypothetical protein